MRYMAVVMVMWLVDAGSAQACIVSSDLVVAAWPPDGARVGREAHIVALGAWLHHAQPRLADGSGVEVPLRTVRQLEVGYPETLYVFAPLRPLTPGTWHLSFDADHLPAQLQPVPAAMLPRRFEVVDEPLPRSGPALPANIEWSTITFEPWLETSCNYGTYLGRQHHLVPTPPPAMQDGTLTWIELGIPERHTTRWFALVPGMFRQQHWEDDWREVQDEWDLWVREPTDGCLQVLAADGYGRRSPIGTVCRRAHCVTLDTTHRDLLDWPDWDAEPPCAADRDVPMGDRPYIGPTNLEAPCPRAAGCHSAPGARVAWWALVAALFAGAPATASRRRSRGRAAPGRS